MSRKQGRTYEVHEHAIIAGPRYRPGMTPPIVHSHEGGSVRHQHPDTGPASYTIDRAEWARATGLRGGGRKTFTPTPSGEQLPVVALEAWQQAFDVIVVGDGGASPTRGASGGAAVPAAMRMIQQFRMKANVRRDHQGMGGRGDERADSG